LKKFGFRITQVCLVQQGLHISWISIRADGDLNWQFVEELAERSYRRLALKNMIAAIDGQ